MLAGQLISVFLQLRPKRQQTAIQDFSAPPPGSFFCLHCLQGILHQVVIVFLEKVQEAALDLPCLTEHP
jgi:hypothetical protein